ncbi:3958_t:CDS:2, partial [Funneliformis mosseae]
MLAYIYWTKSVTEDNLGVLSFNGFSNYDFIRISAIDRCLSRRSSVTSIVSVFSNTSVSNAVAESLSQKLYTSIQDSILSNITVASNGIPKPYRSKAKNICRELKLQKNNLRDLIKAGVLDLNKK